MAVEYVLDLIHNLHFTKKFLLSVDVTSKYLLYVGHGSSVIFDTLYTC
jgi:hypothetical protein